MNRGYIRVYRKLEDWDWYKNPTILALWIHILMKANHTNKKWQGEMIKRGSFITGLKQLANDTGLSVQQIRTGLKKLELTSNLTSKSTNKYRIITVLDYNDYQNNNKQPNKQTTNKQQSNNNQITPTNNLKNDKHYKALEEKHYDNFELNELFIEFLKLRKTLKAVNSERAIKGLKNKMKMVDDNIKIQMINNAIIGSWKTVYELKGNGNTSKEVIPDAMASFYEGIRSE